MRRLAMIALALLLARPALAQKERGGDGFLFQEPTVSFGLRLGYDRALAGSDLFSFVTDNLTLERGSFSSATFAGDMGIRLSSRTDLVLGLAVSSSSSRSEFRDWVDNNDLPIEQTTSFKRVPLTVGVKHYLRPRGRMLGRYAWIPSRYAPYLGFGGGFIWYRFRQSGDFIDFNTLRVFPDEFNSSGWTQSLHGMAGLELAVGTHLAFVGEMRYTWAKAPLDADFVGFHRLDLSGLSLTGGVSLRF